MANIRWLGHASFEVVTKSGKIIYLDPWIRRNPIAPISIEDIKKANIICVSHGHEDHIGDSIEIAKTTGAKLICSPEIGFYADSKGIPYDEGSYPLNVGGSVTIDDISIFMTNAAHTSEVYGEEWFTERRALPGSGAVGYVIAVKDDIRIYFAGDTGLTMDMRIIGDIFNPDVALLPIGGKYNMGPREAAIATQWIRPRVVIPMHYNTYPAIQQDPANFKEQVDRLVMGVRTVVLKPGETFEWK